MTIPQWAINWVTSKALPKFLDKLNSKVQSYPEYLKKHGKK